MLPPNIMVDRNFQPTLVTQNAFPEKQELTPPPDKVGLKPRAVIIEILTFRWLNEWGFPLGNIDEIYFHSF